MGKSTISMVIFNSYVKLPEGVLVGDEDPQTPATLMWTHRGLIVSSTVDVESLQHRNKKAMNWAVSHINSLKLHELPHGFPWYLGWNMVKHGETRDRTALSCMRESRLSTCAAWLKNVAPFRDGKSWAEKIMYPLVRWLWKITMFI